MFPNDLIVTNSYYCDAGIHSGKFYVKLEGYVTPDELQRLQRGWDSECVR